MIRNKLFAVVPVLFKIFKNCLTEIATNFSIKYYSLKYNKKICGSLYKKMFYLVSYSITY